MNEFQPSHPSLWPGIIRANIVRWIIGLVMAGCLLASDLGILVATVFVSTMLALELGHVGAEYRYQVVIKHVILPAGNAVIDALEEHQNTRLKSLQRGFRLG